MQEPDDFRLDKRAFSVGNLSDPDDAPAYWKTRTPEERLRAVEVIRQILYGYTDSSARIKRVLTVAELGDEDDGS